MKYFGESLTNDLKTNHHLTEKKTNIQSNLHACICTTKNEILLEIKTRT